MTTPRHALAIPVGLFDHEVQIKVPAYGSRMIGPLWPSRTVGGFMIEIKTNDDGPDSFALAFALQDLLNGRTIGDVAMQLCQLRLGTRILGLDGDPIDKNDYLRQRWASFKRDVEIDDEKTGRKPRHPNKSEFARELYAERDLIPWYGLSSDPARATETIRTQLRRLGV
jgi:hypothetical protein